MSIWGCLKRTAPYSFHRLIFKLGVNRKVSVTPNAQITSHPMLSHHIPCYPIFITSKLPKMSFIPLHRIVVVRVYIYIYTYI
jgi:hypothetical protein